MQNIVETLNELLSGPIMVWGVLTLGIILTFKTRFIQFRKLGYTLKYTFGEMFKKQKTKSGISPFQAVTTALSGTIGTGNIVGVATAISIGGAGAIFWMWVSAFFGMATKYSEIVLAIKYRKQDANGNYLGGPMFYMQRAMGKKWLGVCFAILCLVSSFGIGNMVQSNAIGQSIATITSFDIRPIIIIIAAIVGFVTIGGIQRIAKTTQALIPAMAVFYILGCLVIIFMNLNQLGSAILEIVQSAFNVKSAGGGILGYAMIKAIKVGFSRGVFTNEAGLGSAPIAHAAAETDHPARQGLWGIFEVFFDTIVMCTLTGIVIVLSGSHNTDLQGADMTFNAFDTYLGSFATTFIAISTIFFAVSTIIGWSYYGETCINFLFKKKFAMLVYKFIFICAIYFGAISSINLVWGLSDLFNSLMMIPNILALALLANVVRDETKDFDKKLRVEKKRNKRG